MHILRPTPVRKEPRNNDASRGIDGPPGDDSGENWGIADDPDQDFDRFGCDTHVDYLAPDYVKTCGIFNTSSLK